MGQAHLQEPPGALLPARRESGGLSNAEPKGEELPQDNLLSAVANSESGKRE